MLAIEILKSMDFKGEDYSHFWNSEDYYFVKYTKKAGEDYKFIDGNVTYKRLNNIDEGVHDEYAGNVCQCECLSVVKRLFETLGTLNGGSVKYVREIYANDSMTVWNVTALLEGECLKIMGIRISKDEILTYFPHNNYPGDIERHTGNFDSAMLIKTERGYVIESFNAGLKEIYNGRDYTGRLLKEVLPKTIHDELLMYMIHKAVNENTIMSYYDFLKYSEANSYVKITAIPIIHLSVTRVLLHVDKVFNKIALNTGSTASLSSGMAECIIDVRNPEFKYISEINLKMAYLMEKGSFNAEKIVELDDIQRCIEEGVIISGTLEQKAAGGENKKYSYHFCPTLHGDDIVQVHVTISENKKKNSDNDRLLSELTPREKEIAAHILNGYTNKYISALLNVSEGTVKKMVYNIYRKLNVSSRIELAKLFLD